MKTVSNLTVGHRGSGVAVVWRWCGGGVAVAWRRMINAGVSPTLCKAPIFTECTTTDVYCLI